MMQNNPGNKRVLAEDINRLNKIAVLNLIRQEGEISRAEISKRLKLSAPTVTRIVDSLIHNEELAVQVGKGESSGGRPPVIVRFHGEASRVIGIDWGRTRIRGVVANLNAEVLHQHEVSVENHNDFESDMKSLIGLIQELINKTTVARDKILGIGLAIAGYYNQETQRVEFSPNFGWKDVDIKSRLVKEFEIPVTIDNVSRVMALGELLYGSMTNFKNFIFVNIGYGIGSGIILDGKPFIGHMGFAGELGHNRISGKLKVQEQRQCSCGKTNCLECYASGRGIAQSAKSRLVDNTDSILYRWTQDNPDRLNTEMVARAAEQGDGFAIKLLHEAATMLGVAFANISNIINPEAIVIGGGVANAGEKFIVAITESFQQEILPNVQQTPELRLSENMGSEAVKGVVALTLQEVLNLNIKIQH